MVVLDEASGVEDIIFQNAEGMLTNENILWVMISNPTRLQGYFYESHHRDAHNWQTFQFDSRESPVVDREFVARMDEKYGDESDQFRIQVMGRFPREDAIDSGDYGPLLTDFREIFMSDLSGVLRLGVDPAGEGDDETLLVVRDKFRAKIVGREKTSTPMEVARRTAEVMDFYEIPASNVYVDNFGEGANVAVFLQQMERSVRGVNVGVKPLDEAMFLNKRAECYWRLRQWLAQGGELVANDLWKKEAPAIRYRRNLKGKIQMMPKHKMRQEGYKSPNALDALALTFFDTEQPPKKPKKERIRTDSWASSIGL
jgi:hypothetical protein